MERVRQILSVVWVLGALVAFGAGSSAAADHGGYFSQPLNSGPEVTRACLECHEDAAVAFMKTTHWTWSLAQPIEGRGMVDRGKVNAINNFCVSVSGNWPRCTSCHAGYGWEDASFDFTDETRVDCLVCHDTTGTYKKVPTGAGAPEPMVDLLHVTRHVGKPGRENCGACHFYGGGGDAVKHGDLDSSIAKPTRTLDVHMGTDGGDFACQECHTAEEHRIRGNSMAVSPGGHSPIGCTNCHDENPHGEPLLDGHLSAVACQTCHIPAFARQVPTKTSWDWSAAGQDVQGSPKQEGQPTYTKAKGRVTWGKNVQPVYAWYNGSGGAYLAGDRVEGDGPVELSHPLGARGEPGARIAPFKVHTGRQPFDPEHRTLITPKVFGEGGYWKTFDWIEASRLGMEASGLPFSGQVAFIDTVMYWPLNHMVAPAS